MAGRNAGAAGVGRRAEFDPTRWQRTLVEALFDAADLTGDRPALEDQERQPLSRRRLILAAMVLGRALARATRPGERVGVLLPNVNGVAVAVFALLAYGRVPAMLNFTAGLINLESATQAAEIRTIVTSRKFVEAAKLEDVVAGLAKQVKIVFLEDVRARLSLFDKLFGALKARVPRLANRSLRARPDDVAVVLFTSGTERQPKAVALSHANILANIEQIVWSFDFTADDLMFNALPVFHAFGLTGGLFLPLLAGFRDFLYPSPLHYHEIPGLVRDSGATILLGIDTLAAGWGRAAGDDDFRTVRLFVCGAERVKDATRRLWRERFGKEIFEGYGVTEGAPVLGVNTPDDNRPGSVGKLFPAIEWRLVPVPGIESGQRLQVRGPNIMAGYYFADEPGILHPPPNGWHDTGDIVTLDTDGFVTIVARAKRFAKIAGEMVSLAAVEGFVAVAWPDNAHAVVAVPDPRKGEALVVVTDAPAMTKQSLLPTARQLGFRETAVPDRILVVDQLPLLGNGKTDYVSLEKLARDKLAGRAAGSSASPV